MKNRSFSAGLTYDQRIITITFKNGSHCVRALRGNQGMLKHLKIVNIHTTISRTQR